MSLIQQIKEVTAQALSEAFSVSMPAAEISVNQTKPEFEGDYTIVLFALVKQLKKSPDQLGKELGDILVAKNESLFTSYNIIKGFLNLTVNDSYFTAFLNNQYADGKALRPQVEEQRIMVEYSSPNTNKPLHLGHLRNNFLGWSVAEILKSNGYNVHKVQIINDRGIHICKSMAAWTLYGDGETPQSTGIKGDHLVGKYYVEFDKAYKAQVKALIEKGTAEAEAE